MGVESVTGIWDFNALWPLSTDDRTTADDHHRLIKSGTLLTFPNIEATVNASHTELNYLTGVESSVQGTIDSFSADINLLQAEMDVVEAKANTNSADIATLEANLDTLSGNVANTYHGNFLGTGATLTQWPSGWSIAKTGTGIYSITHGLNDAFPVVNPTPGTFGMTCSLGATSPNGFEIWSYQVTNGTATYADTYVMFSATFA